MDNSQLKIDHEQLTIENHQPSLIIGIHGSGVLGDNLMESSVLIIPYASSYHSN